MEVFHSLVKNLDFKIFMMVSFSMYNYATLKYFKYHSLQCMLVAHREGT